MEGNNFHLKEIQHIQRHSEFLSKQTAAKQLSVIIIPMRHMPFNLKETFSCMTQSKCCMLQHIIYNPFLKNVKQLLSNSISIDNTSKERHT